MDEAPLHLGVIPDGNRRWAKAKGLLAWNGHERAVKNFRSLTEWCRSHPRIGTLTVWCFSTENWKRDPEEIAKLMQLLEEYLQKERKTFKDENTRFVHSGRRDRIPASLAKLIQEVEEETLHQSLRSGTGQAPDPNWFTLHLAVDYGGKDEVVRALKKIQSGERPSMAATSAVLAAVTEEEIRANLDHPELPDIDLVLRSSGEQRTSNFFLWQSTYAEWIFTPKFFPEIGTEDLAEAVAEFDRRKRRFGS